MKKKSFSTGQKLTAALTQEQIESILDIVGNSTIIEKLQINEKKCEADLLNTVKAVLQPDRNKKPQSSQPSAPPVTSKDKSLKEWNDLWGQWYGFVGEIGDEDGNYVIQEHHWEEPYFDGSAVASDLEKVATEMIKRIETVYDLVGEPGLFTSAIEEIEDAIKSYPDWMGAENECCLEYQTTHCILKWFWLSIRDDAAAGTLLLEWLDEIALQYTIVLLDRAAIIDFIVSLPEMMCRQIHDELQNGRYSQEQEKTYSPWNAIAKEFERRYDKKRYFDHCAHDLEENWHDGIPLIQKAFDEKDWNVAQEWLVKTSATLLHTS
ncbi:MAG: hypothetical protein JW795_11750, partial [Chitinivibrionales bacterium]|nr:hypothetical protein [Chitinivibrionales bacterium]